MTFTQSLERNTVDQTDLENQDLPRSPGSAPDLTFVWIFSEIDEDKDATLARYLESIEKIERSSELIVVNNGAPAEKTAGIVEQLENCSIPSRVMTFHRTAIESAVASAAFKAARGKVMVCLPSYVQIDPDDVGDMLNKIEDDGCDYVASWRRRRVDSKSATRMSEFFNWLTRKITGIKLHDLNSGLRVMRREVVQEVAVYGDLFRFYPVLAAMQGFRVDEVATTHLEEKVHRGDYRMGIILRRLLDLLTLFFLLKFTRKPLRFFGLIGSGTLLLGAILNVVMIAQRMVFEKSLADRPLFIVGVLLIVLGVQLFSIGLLGELMIFLHAREMKEYQVDTVHEIQQRRVDTKSPS